MATDESSESQQHGQRSVSRRRFLAVAGAGGIVVAAGALLRSSAEEVVPTAVEAARTAAGGRLFRLRRREDLLNLQFELINADVMTDGTVRPVAAGPSYLVVHFPAQTVLEAARTTSPDPAGLPVATRVGGDSRLAFDITARLPMVFNVAQLLWWAGFTPSLTRSATAAQAGAVLAEPQPHETAVEIPWRVLLSPNEHEGWKHATAPVTHNGWTELWHTRLGQSSEDAEGQPDVDDAATGLPVRAVWLSDPDMPRWLQGANVPVNDSDIENALGPKARFSVVRLSADPALRATDADLPQPFEVNRLMLSSLGGWIDAEGSWDYTGVSGIDLSGWQHKGTMGRDHFVRTTSEGFLFPFGHPAALVEVSERRFERNTDGKWMAYNRITKYVVVRKTVKTYDQRNFPFQKVRVLAPVSPDLQDPVDFVTGSSDYKSFVVRAAGAGGAALPYALRATDWSGRDVDISVPVIFMFRSTAENPTLMAQVHDAYNNRVTTAAAALRTVGTGGRKVALAPTGPHPKGSTTANVVSLVLNSEPATGTAGKAPFRPFMERATLRQPEIEAATGINSAATAFVYAPSYLTSGITGPNNPGGVFLAKHPAEPAKPLDVPTQKTGVATPTGDIQSLSAKRGPVTAKELDAAKELFDPQALFGDTARAKLLGGVPLKDVMAPPAQGIDGDLVPRFTYTFVPDPAATNPAIPSGWYKVTMDWAWKGKPDPLGVFVPMKPADPKKPGNTVAVRAVTTIPAANPSATTVDSSGEVNNFTLNFFGDGPARFISVDVAFVRYKNVSGAKTDVDVKVLGVAFHGPLKFSEPLSDLFKALGLKFEIVVGSNGIQAGLRWAVPELGSTPFVIKGLGIAIGVVIPFDGSPVRFNFDVSTRENPFQLTISIFTGGGYAGISVGADGVERLEFGFVFGGGMSFKIAGFGVSLEAVVGLSFLLELTEVDVNGQKALGQQLSFTGFLRIRGQVDLSILKVSVELYLGLTYLKKPDGNAVFYGEATVTVNVTLFIFSTSWTWKARKEFSNTAAPTASAARTGIRSAAPALTAGAPIPALSFGDAFTQQDWDTYCAVFAPAGA